MRPPQTRNGGPPAGPAVIPRSIPTTITKPDPANRTASEEVLTAYAVKYLAVGDAMYDWVVVRKCPVCGHAHRHVLFETGATVIERSPACRKHLVYRVQITDVVPSAAARRGAA